MRLATAACVVSAIGGALATLAAPVAASEFRAPAISPRQAVLACDRHGFVTLPGTDICLQVGGRAAFVAYAAQKQWPVEETDAAYGIIPGDAVASDAAGRAIPDTVASYSFARLNLRTRQTTEWGGIESTIEGQMDDDDRRTGGRFRLRRAFVKLSDWDLGGLFGGVLRGDWVFGKDKSTFVDARSGPTYSDAFTVVGDNRIRRNQIRYSRALGGGYAIAVSLEDQEFGIPVAIDAAGDYLWPEPEENPVVRDRNALPDLVAQLSWSQPGNEAVGLSLSGALHRNSFRLVGPDGAPAPLAGNQTGDRLGWAAQFSAAFDAPLTDDRGLVMLKAIYADGANQYNRDNFLNGANVVWGLCVAGDPSSGGCIRDTVTTWSVLGAYQYEWTPNWTGTIGIGYQRTRAPLYAIDPLSATGAATFGVEAYDIFANIEWDLFGGKRGHSGEFKVLLDLHYGHVAFDGSGTVGNQFDPRLIDPLARSDQGAFAAALDIKRIF